MASNIQILSYRQGCLVVADWIEGTPLKTVAEEGDLDPRAVARALAPLVDAATTAHEHDLVLGIDNRNRIRIATDGVAKLAFPAVLERNSVETDVDGINSTITLLTESTASTPQELRDVAHSEQSLEERAKVLHAYANETEQTLEVHEEKVEAPEATQASVAAAIGIGRDHLGRLCHHLCCGYGCTDRVDHVFGGEESPVTKPTQTVTSFPNTRRCYSRKSQRSLFRITRNRRHSSTARVPHEWTSPRAHSLP